MASFWRDVGGVGDRRLKAAWCEDGVKKRARAAYGEAYGVSDARLAKKMTPAPATPATPAEVRAASRGIHPFSLNTHRRHSDTMMMDDADTDDAADADDGMDTDGRADAASSPARAARAPRSQNPTPATTRPRGGHSVLPSHRHHGAWLACVDHAAAPFPLDPSSAAW